MKELEFAALLCSRLCHDLISPVGAISNGIEILADEEDEDMRNEVAKLLELSASQTSNRLKFFRLAFGAAGGIGSQVPIRDAKNAAMGLFEGSPVSLQWNSDVGELQKDAIKLLLNMILVAGESLIRGGEVIVNITQGGTKTNLDVTVKADRIIFQDKMKKTICGEITDIEADPKVAPAYLAANVAKSFGGNIEYVSNDENNFTLSVNI